MHFKPSTTLSIQCYEVNHDEVTTEAHVELIINFEAEYWQPMTKDKLLKLAEALVQSHQMVDFAEIEIFIDGKTYRWETSSSGTYPMDEAQV